MTQTDARIVNLMEFTAQDVDLRLIEAKLWRIRRFNGHPGALFVRPHAALVQQLAIRDSAERAVISWSYYHDDHEGIIGDVIGPVEAILRRETKLLDYLKSSLDECICEARGMSYPSAQVREAVHYYDKLAEALEWQIGLGYKDAGFHPSWPMWLDWEQANQLFHWAKTLRENSTTPA